MLPNNNFSAPSESARRPNYSMPGLTYMAMPLGAIRIGHLQQCEAGQPALPVMDDEFHLTLPAKSSSGRWMLDPLDKKLRAERGVQVSPGTDASPEPGSAAQIKLRSIPIRVLVNDPSLVLRSRLEAFDSRTKRPVCTSTTAGSAHRVKAAGGFDEVACVGVGSCVFASQDHIRCKLLGRIHVQIVAQDSTLGTYVLRSTSYNTLRTFEAKLWQYWALFGGKLRGVPFRMQLRMVTTALSSWMPFYVVDLELDGVDLDGALDAAEAQAARDARFDMQSLEKVLRDGLANGLLTQDPQESDVADEFYCDELNTGAADQVFSHGTAVNAAAGQALPASATLGSPGTRDKAQCAVVLNGLINRAKSGTSLRR